MYQGQKVWLVEEPLSQYKEDVKSLAKANGLAIVNARFKDMVKAEKICDNPPELTKKRGRKPSVKEEPKPVISQSESEAS